MALLPHPPRRRSTDTATCLDSRRPFPLVAGGSDSCLAWPRSISLPSPKEGSSGTTSPSASQTEHGHCHLPLQPRSISLNSPRPSHASPSPVTLSQRHGDDGGGAAVDIGLADPSRVLPERLTASSPPSPSPRHDAVAPPPRASPPPPPPSRRRRWWRHRRHSLPCVSGRRDGVGWSNGLRPSLGAERRR